MENCNQVKVVRLQRYTHLTIGYISGYLLHDTIRIAICFSRDNQLLVWIILWSTKVLTILQSLFEMVRSHRLNIIFVKVS